LARVVETGEGCGDWQVDWGATGDQGAQCVQFAVQRGGVRGGSGIGAVVTQEIDERELHVAFAWDASRGDEHEGVIFGGLSGAGVENNAGDFDDVGRERAVANGIFRDKFEEGGIAEVVAAFEEDTLLGEMRMLMQMRTKSWGVAGIEQIDSAAKRFVFDALLMGQIEAIGEGWAFDVAFQPCPAGKTVLARDGELGIGEGEAGGEDLWVRGAGEPRMKLAEPLRHAGCAGGVILEQVLRLMLQMIEVGMRR
jgi:hypothetical protein